MEKRGRRGEDGEERGGEDGEWSIGTLEGREERRSAWRRRGGRDARVFGEEDGVGGYDGGEGWIRG
jgi:hypothetical protein